MTGGELVVAAGDQFGGFFSVTRSQVYRELPALVEAGLLRLGKLGVRASQQYRITAAGKRSFKAWLAADRVGSTPCAARSCSVCCTRRRAVRGRARAGLVGTSRTSYAAERLKAAQERRVRPRIRDGARLSFTVAHLEFGARAAQRHPDRAGGHRLACSVVRGRPRS